ncbi:MAG TPA: hypothetical protein VGF28_21935 [Thermoanaerobaculia bacterium]|jgi:hypothetical protein
MQRKPLLLSAALIALAFLIGYIPNEIAARRLAQTLRSTQLELRLANLHRQLGVASHQAQRNNFGLAANVAAGFFSGCRAAVDDFRFQDRPRTRIALESYAQQGDTLLGELANGDPAAKERLASMYLTMDGVLVRRQ